MFLVPSGAFLHSEGEEVGILNSILFFKTNPSNWVGTVKNWTPFWWKKLKTGLSLILQSRPPHSLTQTVNEKQICSKSKWLFLLAPVCKMMSQFSIASVLVLHELSAWSTSSQSPLRKGELTFSVLHVATRLCIGYLGWVKNEKCN